MGVCEYESHAHGCGSDDTMVKNTWYTYLGRQNLEGVPANPGDNGFLLTGKKFKGYLNVMLVGAEDYEIRVTVNINGAWYSEVWLEKPPAGGVLKRLSVEGRGMEIDIRCTSSENGDVVYDFCVERATCV